MWEELNLMDIPFKFLAIYLAVIEGKNKKSLTKYFISDSCGYLILEN